MGQFKLSDLGTIITAKDKLEPANKVLIVSSHGGLMGTRFTPSYPTLIQWAAPPGYLLAGMKVGAYIRGHFTASVKAFINDKQWDHHLSYFHDDEPWEEIERHLGVLRKDAREEIAFLSPEHQKNTVRAAWLKKAGMGTENDKKELADALGDKARAEKSIAVEQRALQAPDADVLVISSTNENVTLCKVIDALKVGGWTYPSLLLVCCRGLYGDKMDDGLTQEFAKEKKTTFKEYKKSFKGVKKLVRGEFKDEVGGRRHQAIQDRHLHMKNAVALAIMMRQGIDASKLSQEDLDQSGLKPSAVRKPSPNLPVQPPRPVK